jgi:hypothetical protein
VVPSETLVASLPPITASPRYSPAVGALSSKLDRAYLPCVARSVVCRREGCAELATDDVLCLCAGHLAEYRRRTAPVLAPKPPRLAKSRPAQT